MDDLVLGKFLHLRIADVSVQGMHLPVVGELVVHETL